MTENKMPDIIWCGMTFVGGPFWSPKCTHHKKDDKYFRAERVEELLRQARRVIFESQIRFANNGIAEPWGVDETITAIDKFLEGNK